MSVGLHFFPDAQRARQLNRRMHAELAASLRHVLEQSRGVLNAPTGLEAVLKVLDEGVSYPAHVFAGYYQLVEAILAEDLAAAQIHLEAIAAATPQTHGLTVEVLGSEHLGERSDLYQRLMSGDASLEIGFVPPSAEVATAFKARLEAGLGLMRRTLPDLAGEIEAIVREVIIAGSDPSKRMQFDGGSHYQLWGALFLNGQFHPDELAVVEVLAHESAHSLLFGFCTEHPLVENADDELFASPLRPDLRPMDGIYHATFVSARMHWAMTKIAMLEVIEPAMRERAREAAEADLKNFWSGHGVVAAHGRLTPLGKGLMDEARAYMETVS